VSTEHPAIVGLGLTAMSTRPGGDSEQLANQAVRLALADAGLEASDVDGLLVNSSQGIRPDRLGVALAHRGGLGNLRLLEHIEIKGATAAAMVQRAVLTIRASMATTVVCVFGDAPLQPGGTAGSLYANSGGLEGLRGLERANGLHGSVPTFALLASRFLATRHGTVDDLCATACTARRWAQGNPDAVARSELTAEQYFASPMVSSPLRVVDCARPVNGAGAVVVSARAAAPGSSQAIFVRGMSQWHPMRRRRAPEESWFGGDAHRAVDGALSMARLTRTDLDVLELYDPFSVVTLCLLEDYGFCAPGAAGAMMRAGAMAPGGPLPTNTGGGQLSGFYLQGITPLAEAIIQLRGRGGDRQVAGASSALVAGIGGRIDHHACLVLATERR
jgi:acetyl-CoA acetyltransferase